MFMAECIFRWLLHPWKKRRYFPPKHRKSLTLILIITRKTWILNINFVKKLKPGNYLIAFYVVICRGVSFRVSGNMELCDCDLIYGDIPAFAWDDWGWHEISLVFGMRLDCGTLWIQIRNFATWVSFLDVWVVLGVRICGLPFTVRGFYDSAKNEYVSVAFTMAVFFGTENTFFLSLYSSHSGLKYLFTCESVMWF